MNQGLFEGRDVAGKLGKSSSENKYSVKIIRKKTSNIHPTGLCIIIKSRLTKNHIKKIVLSTVFLFNFMRQIATINFRCRCYSIAANSHIAQDLGVFSPCHHRKQVK